MAPEKLRRMRRELGPAAEQLPIIVADDPLTTVALGSGQTLDSIETLRRVIIT